MSRLLKWIEESNARSDARLAASSTHMLLARLVFGLLIAARGIAIFVQDAPGWRYLIALLLIAGGAALALEGGKALRHQRSARKAG